MASKRMFSRELTESDAFLDLSLPAQCLYFHACLTADDEGFISSGKRLARVIGAAESDLQELVNHGFLIAFDSGVYAAAHFWVNNTLRSDRFHETVYQAERKQLEKNENGVYVLRQPVVNQPETNGQPTVNAVENSIVEDRKDKERKDKVSIEEGSPEGGNLLSDDPETVRTFLTMTRLDGIGNDAEQAVRKYGLNVAHAAYTQWRNSGKVIGKYNDFLKGE